MRWILSKIFDAILSALGPSIIEEELDEAKKEMEELKELEKWRK